MVEDYDFFLTKRNFIYWTENNLNQTEEFIS